MSAPGAPPDVGTIARSDDRYPYSAWPVAEPSFNFQPDQGAPDPNRQNVFSGQTFNPVMTAPATPDLPPELLQADLPPPNLTPPTLGNIPQDALYPPGGDQGSMSGQVSAPRNRGEVASYITDAAMSRGIDPAVALKVFTQESGLNPAARNVNDREASYGIAQLNVKGGLGNEARKAGIEPSDPRQWRQQVDFALDTVKKDGWRQWYGARDVGISRWQGIAKGAAAQLAAFEPSSTPLVPNAPSFGDPGYSTPTEPFQISSSVPYLDQLNALASEPPASEPTQAPDEPFAPMDIPFQTEMAQFPVLPAPEPTVTFERSPLYTPAQTTQMSRAVEYPQFDSNEEPTHIKDLPITSRTFMEELDQATRGPRQYARGLLQSGGGLVYGTMANLAALKQLPYRLMGVDNPQGEEVVNFWTDLLAKSQRGANQLTGLASDPEPGNTAEKILNIAGQNTIPAGKLTLPLTAIGTGVNVGVDAAFAASKKRPAATFEGMVAPGNIDTRKIGTYVNTYNIPQADGTVIAIPSSSLYGSTNLPLDKAVQQFQRTGVNFGKFRDEGAAQNFVDALNSRVPVPVETVNGPGKKVSTGELALMGTLGAFTIGLALVPGGGFQSTTPRLGRPVERAAPGTMDYTTLGDLASTYHDVNAGALRVAGKIIPDQQRMQNIRDVMTIQTRGGASNIADSAVNQGRAEGINFRFNVQTPLGEIDRAATPEMAQYTLLRDTFDDLQLAQQKQANQIAQRIPVPPGPVTVRGMTEADVLNQIAALERANPEVRAVHQAYQQNLREYRRFLSTGEFATMSRAEQQELNATRPNEVPFIGTGGRIWEDPNFDRGSPYQALGEKMRTDLRFRMENEAKGLYVDAMRQAEPSTFVRITQSQLNNNPHWRPQVVTIYRRGQKEMYTTAPLIADVLRMDPYYFQNKIVDAFYNTKRLAEATTTGMFAPWFSMTSFLRNHQIIKPTAPTMPGLSAPNIFQSLMGIPRQLGPQIARSASRAIDANGPLVTSIANSINNRLNAVSAGWLNQTLGPQFTQALSRRLMTIYNDSLFARLEAAGSHRGSVLEHQIMNPTARHWRRLSQTNNAVLNRAIQTTDGATRAFLNGWKATWGAVHNAPSYAFARRNEGRLPIQQLAMRTRQVTGDPMSGGEFMTTLPTGPTGAGKRVPIPGPSYNTMGGYLATKAVQYGLGIPSEFGRAAIPWFNPSLQGMKRIGQAYLDNPRQFVMHAWLYTQLPAAVAYAWNKYAGMDPQGQSYSDYMMNGRSQYNTMMNYYLAIPGRPVSQGIQIPRFHELAPLARWMEIAMDHAFGSPQHTNSEDFLNVVGNGIKVVFGPATPPLFNLLLANLGMVGPQGVFEGDAYKPRGTPFDQNAGLPANVELYMRAIAPGLADVFGSALAASIQAGDGTSPVGAFGKEAWARTIAKAPVTRDIFKMAPPQTGNTRMTEEFFNKQRSIDNLVRFFKDNGLAGGAKMINTEPKSMGGGQIAQQLLGKPIPPEAPGLGQPQPTNPLYKMFMQEVYNKFVRDDPEKGGMGFKSVMARYGDASQALKTMQKINAGNYVTWQKQLEQMPDTLEFIKENGVDWKNPLAVKSFYEMYRQNAAKELLHMIRSVEHDFSQRVGKPIKLEDLDPYGNGLTQPLTSDFSSGFEQQY